MAPMAALIAAALHLGFPSMLASHGGGDQNASAQIGAAIAAAQGEIGTRSTCIGTRGAEGDLSSGGGIELFHNSSWLLECGSPRGSSTTIGDDHGEGKYLVPQLEPSPNCLHKQVTHGANRMQSFQKCLDCHQEQKMPLTPLAELHHWNNTLVFMKEDFYKRLVNKAVVKKDETATTAKFSPMTAVKSKAKARGMAALAKSEEHSEEEQWEVPHQDHMARATFIGEEDVAMEELTSQPHEQTCDACHQGMMMLHQHQVRGDLQWKCDNPQCLFFLAEISQHLVPARGIFLCPQCNSREMTVITSTNDPEETEVQCLNPDCNLQMFLFEMPLVYSRMGRFNVMALQH